MARDSLSTWKTLRHPSKSVRPLVLLLGSALPGLAQNAMTAEQAAQLEVIRTQSLQRSAAMPDFTCTQITQRSQQLLEGRKPKPRKNVVEELVSFTQGAERHDLVTIDGKRASKEDTAWRSGANSTGEYGIVLRNVFDPRFGAKFEFKRMDDSLGVATAVYGFSVGAAFGWELSFPNYSVPSRVAYRGEFYADRQTNNVLRVFVEAVDIPPLLPAKAVSDQIDYGPVTIGERTFWLPVRFRLTMRTASALTENQSEYRNCRKFEAESQIKFE